MKLRKEPDDVARELGQAAARAGWEERNPYPPGRRAAAWAEAYHTELQRMQADRDVDRDFHY